MFYSEANFFNTQLKITVIDEVKDKSIVMGQLFEEVSKMHQAWNIFSNSSLITKLNKEDQLVVDPLTRQILIEANNYSQISDYYFNHCLYEQKIIWDQMKTTDKKENINLVLKNSSVHQFDGNKVTLNGSKVDLGGIAKGFALDYLVVYAQSLGINNILIDFGGAVYGVGKYKLNDDSRGFNIGVKHPEDNSKQILSLWGITNLTVMTSANYEQLINVEGVDYYHIFSPTNKDDILAVTIVGKSASFADAMCTAVMAMGLKKGLEFLDQYAEIDYYIVDKHKNIYYQQVNDYELRLEDNDYKLINYMEDDEENN